MKRILIALVALGAALGAAPVIAQDGFTPVAEQLAYMREEEKLAYDVYMFLDGLYGAQAPGERIFARIAQSETRHTEAVRKLLDKYLLVDPAAYTQPGEFQDTELQELYDTLVAVGSQGLTQALGVGVTIEQKDMIDIVEAIEISVEYPDIVQVYSNLLAGSESHLAAFLKVLETAGQKNQEP